MSIPCVGLCSRSINKYRDSNYQQEEDDIYYDDGDDFDDYQEEKPGVQDSEYYYYDDQPPAPPNFFQSMDFPRYSMVPDNTRAGIIKHRFFKPLFEDIYGMEIEIIQHRPIGTINLNFYGCSILFLKP